jgi:hypothetical protein
LTVNCSVEVERESKIVKTKEKEQGEEATMDRKKSAAKADDAEIPEYLWDQVLVPDQDPYHKRALTQFRTLGRWWKRRTRKKFLMWFYN